jgi:hypothetical protein
MSTDSVDQLRQARGDIPIHDWFPPMMAFIWRWTDHVVAGPLPMLVLQSLLFLLGVDGILRRVTSPRAAAAIAVAVLLFPPVLTTMAVIWKDSQMCGYLMAGTACILSSDRRWRAVGLVLYALATAMRYNAPAAILPLVGLLLVWRHTSGLRRYAVALAAWLAITTAAFAVSSLVVEEHTYPWVRSVALFDIVGTLRYAGGKARDDDVRELLEGAPLAVHDDFYRRLHAAYSPFNYWPIVHDDVHIFNDPQTEAERDAVARDWLRVVRAHPWSYLVHRAHVFQGDLALIDDPINDTAWTLFVSTPDQEDMIGHRAVHSWVQRTWGEVASWLGGTFLFRPHFYALLGLAVLGFCRHDRLAFALLASGLCYEAGLFFVTPGVNYRYSHCMVSMVVVATTVLVLRRALRGAMSRGRTS